MTDKEKSSTILILATIVMESGDYLKEKFNFDVS